jgi:hypothetical protein
MTSFAVKPDLSPRFVTGLESDSLRYGQSASYRPVAIDPEGDSVSLVAILPPRSPLRWDGKRLILPANVTGRHFAEILAKDAHGNRTIQTIDWVVDPSGKGVFLEGRSESDLGLFTVGTDLRGARIGLFTPSFGRLTGWTERLDMQLPYFFLGVNFFRTREDRLTMDVGLTARSPSKQFYTGGGMARLQGSLTWHAPFAWKSEFDVTGWIDQAMLVADTSGTKDVTLTWANYGANPAWNLNRVQTYKTAWWPVKDKVRRDQIRRDNSVVLTRLDLLGGVKPWLWTGPSWWLDARPLLNQVENFAGWAVKADARLGPMRLTPAGRMGWGFNSGLTMAGSVNLNLGGE